jgi:hypothetical protein
MYQLIHSLWKKFSALRVQKFHRINREAGETWTLCERGVSERKISVIDAERFMRVIKWL